MSYSPLLCLSLGSEVSVMTSMEDEEVGDLEEKKEVGKSKGLMWAESSLLVQMWLLEAHWEPRGVVLYIRRRGPGNKPTRSWTPTLTPHCIWTPHELDFTETAMENS